MSLPLHLLRLFWAVVQSGGFSRAAEALHISQPAVSKAVRELEAQLGAPLIERGPSGGGTAGVRLTEAGTALAAHARSLFAVERAAEEELRAIRGLEQGSLCVAASTTVATYHLPPVLAAFAARHPGIRLRLMSANTQAVLDLLVARDVDIALVEGPVDDPRVEVLPWRAEDMALVAHPGHRLARRGTAVRSDELRDELFVVREPGSGTRDVAESLLSAMGLAPHRVMEVGSTEAIKQLVAAGLGVAIVSLVAAADQLALARLQVLPIVGHRMSRIISRLNLVGRRPGPAAAAFDRMLDDVCAETTTSAPAMLIGVSAAPR